MNGKRLNNSKSKLITPILLVPVLLLIIQIPAFAKTVATSAPELTTFKAIILGLVEGFTEYLPVSSTGHLLVTNKILGLGQTASSEKAIETYAIAIQLGAIAAVLVLYKDRIIQIIKGAFGQSEDGRRIFIAIISAFIPTAIIGLIAKSYVEQYLFGPLPIATAWIVGGVAILFFTQYKNKHHLKGIALSQITTKQALIIGTSQAIALWPGTSRSLVTIISAVLVGLTLKAAVEFSFLLGLVTLSAATALSIVEDGDQLVEEFGYLNPIIGLIVAFVAAMASIKFMVTWLETKSFNIFGYYRIIIGVITLVAVWLNFI